MKKALFTIFAVLLIDQVLKVWVKLNFQYGETMSIIPGWFKLQFVENPGMAFGWMIPGEGGKLALSIFRIVVVIGISVYLSKLIKQQAHKGLIICVSLIVAGALGNIIDSAVYGQIFNKGSQFDQNLMDYTMYHGKAELGGHYAAPLMGNVVDMLHFEKTITWNGKTIELFPPVFNVADSAITIGIILILLFQKRFFEVKKEDETAEETTVTIKHVPDSDPSI